MDLNVTMQGKFDASVRDHTVAGLEGLEHLPVVLALAVDDVLDVDGASLSLFSDGLRMPLGSANHASAVAEALEFTLGDGPCLQAHLERGPVRYSTDEIAERWPVYGALWRAATPFRSCASIPLDLGDGLEGSLDLYTSRPAAVSDAVLADARTVALVIAHLLLESAELEDTDYGPGWLRAEPVRRRATGWSAIARLVDDTEMTSSDALAVLRGYAFQRGATVDEVAAELVITHTLHPVDILDG